MMKEKYVLEVLNPRNAMKIEGFQGLTNSRLTSMDGKRIAIVSEKPDTCLYLNQLIKILREKHPSSTFDLIIGNIFMPESILDRLKQYDAFIYGVRNTAAFNTEPAVLYEKSGIPGVHLCAGDNLIGQTRRTALAFGLPGLRIVKMPAERWPGENETELFIKLAENTIDDIEKALTDPLKDEEKNPKPVKFDTGNMFFEGEDYGEAFDKFQNYFLDNGYSDGLAVAPPTPAAVKHMLTGTSRDPAEVLPHTMTPGYGIVTIEKIAANAVMAGAKPEYLPVIITAVEMLCDPSFLAFHAIATVCSTHLLIAISGPITKELGMNTGTGYLGPGNRANSSIGRAVSLCAINLGWMDFSIDGGMKGNPTRYCNVLFCENEDDSPWEPYHVSRGFKPEDSIVLVEEVTHIDGDWPFEITRLPSSVWTYGFQADLDRIAERAIGASPTALEFAAKNKHDIHRMSANVANPMRLMSSRNYLLVLYPGQARELAAAGYTRESLARYIGDYNRFPWDELGSELQEGILEVAKSGELPGLSVDDCKPGGTVPVFDTNRLAIFVSGPLNGQTMGMTCMGSYGSLQAPVPFEKPPKNPYFVKKITGATLTKYGR